MKIKAESPIFAKTHDLLIWLIPTLSKFPREQRFRLALRLENAVFDFQDDLFRAIGENNPLALRSADVNLRKARYYLRLSQELHFLSFPQYEHVSRMIVEIGRLLGGWIKARGDTGE